MARQPNSVGRGFPPRRQPQSTNEPPAPGLANLLGSDDADQLAATDHMPSFVAWRIGVLLRDATQRYEMDGFTFMQLDRERALLIDHIGACERILATPLPRVYSITIRRFILLFLLALPVALLQQFHAGWLIPLITMFVAYPPLSLDQIGIELENPFSPTSLSHLPLDDISANIERNLFAMLSVQQTEAPSSETST